MLEEIKQHLLDIKNDIRQSNSFDVCSYLFGYALCMFDLQVVNGQEYKEILKYINGLVER